MQHALGERVEIHDAESAFLKMLKEMGQLMPILVEIMMMSCEYWRNLYYTCIDSSRDAPE